jgi:hypothetical protein
MALFPFILVQNEQLKKDEILINHEAIHLRQEVELLIIPFYMLYFINYLVNLCRYRDHSKAYLNIAFEREAYAVETDMSYLKHRQFWSWLKYIA